MKVLFTADWHINLRKKNVPNEWSVARYHSFFEQVHALEETVDLHIIGGDIFDKMPSLEELGIYFDYLKGIKSDVIIYDGNHEATKKGVTFLSILETVSQRIDPRIQIITESTAGPEFNILPYRELHTGLKKLDRNLPLFTHVRGEIPPHVKPEMDLSLLKDFPIVYAGDLHSHSNTQLNIVYPGSPMTIDFHRNHVKTGYLLIDGEEWEWGEFTLPQLIRKTVTSEDEMVSTGYDHTIYEFEGDLTELAKVKNSALLDKKVVKRASEAALVLDPAMGIQQELVEYLSWVLELDEDKVDNLIKVYNDYT